ncbi:MAG: hypothetical protein WCI53_11975 [Bacteroidota bacterium]|jgi:hypothetical protein
MKYLLEVPDNKSDFAEEFFKTISFVKNIKQITSNEITNPLILQSIEDYETGKLNPTPLSLKELKDMLND